ncbi:hypothetical protein D516_0216 [Rhodobacter sp. AKP1]|nr:hypothetical protein D516_0216 [Rhodobacter sp. AKP1]
MTIPPPSTRREPLRQAGLLAPVHLPPGAFPANRWPFARSIPVTAAGPRRISTGFPILRPKAAPDPCHKAEPARPGNRPRSLPKP